MAWTQTDIDRLDAAIASGELTVQHSDGRRITYRSIGELKAARAMVQREVNPPTAPRQRRIITRPGWS